MDVVFDSVNLAFDFVTFGGTCWERSAGHTVTNERPTPRVLSRREQLRPLKAVARCILYFLELQSVLKPQSAACKPIK